MQKFEDACIAYFDNKDIDIDKQVHHVLSGLQDDHIHEWLDIKHPHLMTLTFEEFMKEFRTSYLPPNWEEDMCSEVLSLTQGQQTFWNYVVTLQSKNALLAGTPSHLLKEKLCHQLEANMEKRLKAKCHDANTTLVTDFTKWLQEIKHLLPPSPNRLADLTPVLASMLPPQGYPPREAMFQNLPLLKNSF